MVAGAGCKYRRGGVPYYQETTDFFFGLDVGGFGFGDGYYDDGYYDDDFYEDYYEETFFYDDGFFFKGKKDDGAK